MKSRGGKSQRREEKKKEDQGRERVRRQKMQVREKVAKSRNTVFVQWFVAPEGRKVGSPKRRVRSHLARWEMKSCTQLWREAHFQVKMHKAQHARTTFGSWDVEKVHAAVVRSAFPSQKCKKLRGTEHFWTFRCCFSWQAQGIVHLVKSEQNMRVLYQLQLQPPLHFTPLHSTTLQLQLHYTNFTTLRYTTLHYTTLHSITLHDTTLHYTTLYHTNYTTLHSTSLDTLHSITLHYTTTTTTTTTNSALHYTKYITLHYATPHYTTPHRTTPHFTTLTKTTASTTTTLLYSTLH